MADNYLHKNLSVAHFEGASETIVENPRSFADAMNNLGIRLKNEVLKQITTGNADGVRGESLSASGDLEESLDFHWDIFGETYVGEIFLADYYDHINKGISGDETIRDTPYSWDNVKFPSFQKLSKWANHRGLTDFITPIRKSMFKKGVKGRGYFDRVMNTTNTEIMDLLKRDLKVAGKSSLIEGIKKIIK